MEFNVKDEPTTSGQIDEDSRSNKVKLLDTLITLLNDERVVGEIKFVADSFGMLSDFIRKVESEVLLTDDLLKMVEDLHVKLKGMFNQKILPDKIWQHFNTVILRNKGFMQISQFFTG